MHRYWQCTLLVQEEGSVQPHTGEPMPKGRQSLAEDNMVIWGQNGAMNLDESLRGSVLSDIEDENKDAKVQRIKIAGRNINNLRYADETTLIVERSKEELKSLLMKSERRKWKSWLKAQHSKTKIIASCLIMSWQIDGETMETVTDFIFFSSKITAVGDYSHEIKRRLLLGRKAMTNLDIRLV